MALTEASALPPAEPQRLGWPWILFGLVVLAIPALALLRHTEPPELYGPAPRFELVDQTGATMEANELAGKVSIFSFIFTRCPDVCPLLSTKARWVRDTLDEGQALRTEVELISITVDPAYDTPEVLAEYAARYEAEPESWRFLTGSPEAIDRVVAGFDQFLDRVETGDGPPSIVHSERFVLVDQEGGVRGYFASDEEGLVELVAATRTLAGTWW